jgi:hypothetical protein
MRKYLMVGILGVLWIALASATWFVLVPVGISPMAFGWLNGGVLIFALVIGWIVRDASPGRSLAGILYDTEHPGKAVR